jgi:hypothetical protein
MLKIGCQFPAGSLFSFHHPMLSAALRLPPFPPGNSHWKIPIPRSILPFEVNIRRERFSARSTVVPVLALPCPRTKSPWSAGGGKLAARVRPATPRVKTPKVQTTLNRSGKRTAGIETPSLESEALDVRALFGCFVRTLHRRGEPAFSSAVTLRYMDRGVGGPGHCRRSVAANRSCQLPAHRHTVTLVFAYGNRWIVPRPHRRS